MEKKGDLLNLIHKELSGNITEQERLSLQTLLTQNQDHAQTSDHLSQLWNAPWNDQLFRQITSSELQLQRERLVKEIIRMRQPKKFITQWNLAAAVVILTLITFTLLSVQILDALVVTANRKQNLLLSDNTRITLNQNAMIGFSSLSGAITEFKGEGFFDFVKTNRSLHLNTAIIRVSNASFFVRTAVDSTLMMITKGSVQISFSGQVLTLYAGQQAWIAQKVAAYTQLDPNNWMWFSGECHFKDTKLKQITEILGKQYNATFLVSEQSMLEMPFTGTFINEGLESILNRLSLDMKFTYHLSKGLCTIKPLSK